ncbi:MAG: porin family protein [Cyclobacteriaceae bacterium]
MKKLLIVILLSVAGYGGYAQAQVAIGLKAGVNLSKLNTDDAGANTSNITAFHGGAFALFKLTKIGIQTELLFSQQGSKVEDISGDLQDLKMSYMTIPVMVKFYLAGGFNLQAGPQFGFLNSAEFDGDDVKGSFKNSDISANLGVAWDAPFGIVLDARYNIGLSDISDDTTLGELKSGVFQFSVGYKLIKLGK